MGLSHPAPYIVFMFIGVVFHYLHQEAIPAETAMGVIVGLFLAGTAIMQSGMFSAQLPMWWNYALATYVLGLAALNPGWFRSRKMTDLLRTSVTLLTLYGVAGYVALHFLLSTGGPPGSAF